jgi:hypothetical protein
VPFGRNHQIEPGEVFESQKSWKGGLVIGAMTEHHLLIEDVVSRERNLASRQVDDRYIELSADHPFDQRIGIAFACRQFDVRIFLSNRGEGGASELCATDVIIPNLTRPETLPSSWAISSSARSASRIIGVTRRTSVSPAGVSDMPYAVRVKSSLPKCVSILAICMLSAGWTMFNWRAARVRCPLRQGKGNTASASVPSMPPDSRPPR